VNNRVTDLAKWAPPTRTVRRPDSELATEKLSPVLTAKMVDLGGNVIGVPITNGMSNRNRDDEYGRKIVGEKIRGRPRFLKGTPGGMIPFGKCPQVDEELTRFLPRPLRGRPRCTVSATGLPISDASPCACIEELIRIRQEASRVAAEKLEARLEPMIQKTSREQAKSAATLVEGQAQMIDRLTALVEKLTAAPAPAPEPPTPPAKRGKAS